MKTEVDIPRASILSTHQDGFKPKQIFSTDYLKLDAKYLMGKGFGQLFGFSGMAKRLIFLNLNRIYIIHP